MRPAREVVPGVFVVNRTWGSNVYIITGSPVTVVDAGFPVDAGKITRCFGKGRLENPARVVATHYHLDHMGSLARLKERFAATAAAHAEDAAVIEGSAPYRMFHMDRLRTAYYSALVPLFFRYEHAAVEERLEEGDLVDAMGGLEVVLVGGHTPGSIALYQAGRGILFSGDVLRNEKGVLDGPPPQFSPEIEEAFFNIREKVLGLEFDVLLPGHGEPVTRDAHGAVSRMMKATGRLA